MSKELARLSRKRRKEQLQLNRNKKRPWSAEETSKTNATVAIMKRKEKLQQLREAKRARKVVVKQTKKIAFKHPTAEQLPEMLIAIYGTLESQHTNANIAMLYYGMKKD